MMFNREFHQKILTVLSHLNAEFLADCHTYFGGGTLVSLRHGEHRLSKDIDFMCPIGQGYRLLRQGILDRGYDAIFTSFGDIVLPREIQANQYGIRFPVILDQTPIKFEIVVEGYIQFGSPDYPSWSPVPCLNETDSFAEKLLANADRWPDRRKDSRDIIDLAVQRLAYPMPAEAITKAEKAYPVIEPLKRAIQNFQQQPDYREECFKNLMVNAPERIIDGLDLLASDFGIEATTRTFIESKWDYLDYEEPQVNQNSGHIEASLLQTPQALWNKYIQELDPQRPVERTKAVIRAALQDGLLEDVIASVLEHDPHIQEVKRGQGTDKAQEYIKRLFRSITYDKQQLSQPQLPQQKRQEPNQ